MQSRDVASPVASWDFNSDIPYRSEINGAIFDLIPTDEGVRLVEDPDFGCVAQFDGQYGYLKIPSTDVGKLNVGRTSGEVTVSAWVKVERRSIGFIAGMWQENDNDPRRQYALFTNLDSYGGMDRVVGHVSRNGGASPGLPFSRDCSATARTLLYGEWQHIAFTYDGQNAVSYLDGQTDIFEDYQEPAPPIGNRTTYSKNPYVFDEGLNSTSISDFTVGAVRLTPRMGNYFAGRIAAITVWDRALSHHEIYQSMESTKPRSLPRISLSLKRPEGFVRRSSGGPRQGAWSVEDLGFMSSSQDRNHHGDASGESANTRVLWEQNLVNNDVPLNIFVFELSSPIKAIDTIDIVGRDRGAVHRVLESSDMDGAQRLLVEYASTEQGLPDFVVRIW